MRSTLSLERALAVVSASVLEAAWLTLAYVLLQWLSGARELYIGLAAFAVAVAFGMLLARSARDWQRSRYAAVLVGATIVVAIAGLFLVGGPGVHTGGWLLGLAVWRGTLHAELGDEAELSEMVMRGGVVGLIGFWVAATWTGLIDSAQFTAAAFVATVAFVGAGLLSHGLARLANLEVEQMDRGARRRWVTLLIAITGLVVILAVPVAAILGVPVARSIEALAGPLAPILIQALVLVTIPFAFLTQVLADFFTSFLLPQGGVPLPTPLPDATASPPPAADLPPGALDLSWLGIIIVLALAAVGLMIAAALARPPGVMRRARAFDEERAAEPVSLQLPISLPRLRLPRLRGPSPRTAPEAYVLALAALYGAPDGRLPGETPREHAARVGVENAADMRRLAADYQLASFARTDLTGAEERRAIARWRRVARRVRRPSPRRSAASD